MVKEKGKEKNGWKNRKEKRRKKKGGIKSSR